MRQLATILAEFSQLKLTSNADQARAIMRLSLMDWCAVGLAGQDEPAARIIRNIAINEGGLGQASILGTPGLYPARAAAMVNGVISHALDYDDTHFAHIGHPSVAVIPAALAAAQMHNRSGSDLLDAALIGTEASVRIGLWLGRSHYQSGFHQTATAGAFGACIAVAHLSNLNALETAQALAITASRAAGLKAQFGSMTKPYQAGLAAQTGIEATTLAKAGFSAQLQSLDGKGGFGETHAGQANLNAFDTLGQGWLMTNVSHKFHACCHGTHAMIEALLSLRAQLKPNQISAIKIDTHKRWLNVCNIPAPQSGLEVKFSFTHIAAMVLQGINTASLNSFSDACANDPNLMALAQKVTVQQMPDVAETASRISIKTHDGQHFSVEFDLNQTMEFDLRRDKILAKAQVLLGHEKAQKIWQALLDTPTNLNIFVQEISPPEA